MRHNVCRLFLCTMLIVALAGCAGVKTHGENPMDAGWWESPDDSSSKKAEAALGIERFSMYVMMRDGVKLAVDVYLPRNRKPGDKFPVILLQTRYWRTIDFRWPFTLFFKTPDELTRIVNSGYALVRLDARGSGASFGHRPCPWSVDEIRDGGEVVDWIITQPWAKPKVGAVGGSYEGTAAEFLLVNNHPAVKFVAPLFSVYDVYTDIAFPGGIHLEWFTKVWQEGNRAMDTNRPEDAIWFAQAVTTGVPPVDDDPDGELLARAIKEHEDNYHVHDEAMQIVYRDDRSPGGIHMDDFSPHSFQERIAASKTPIYSYSGWFDGGYAHAAVKRYLTVKNPGSRLILGPWDHGGDDHFRPFDKPVKSKFDHVDYLLRFFDYYLKGKDTGIENEPPVHYYTMVEDVWKSAQSWPPASSAIPARLDENGLLTLNADKNITPGEDEYKVDPTAGTGDTSRWNCLAIDVATNYPDRKKQDLKLQVYTSPPLDADMEVTGHPIADLFIRADRDDAQVFVYLEDVDENGRVSYVTEGMFRAVHRKIGTGRPLYNTPTPYHSFNRADAMPLVPGEVAQLRFDLNPVSYLFKKGHRIRVAIAGADKDHFRALPGPEPTIRFQRGIKNASAVILPVVEKNKP